MKLLIVLGLTLAGLATILPTLVTLAHSQPIDLTKPLPASSLSESPATSASSASESAPVKTSEAERDPLVALASNTYRAEQHYQPQVRQQEVVHHYVYQPQSADEQAAAQQQVAQTGGLQTPSEQPTVVYRVEPTYHYVPVAEQPQEPPTARQLGAEYPGEVVYVGSNGEQIDGSSPQQQDASRSLQNAVSSVADASGMPATILTEVPVKDMPYEVLEKLKREYGVKVVATRERPGANLVINCDEYSGQESSSICKGSSRKPTVERYVYVLSQPEPETGEHVTVAGEQPSYLHPEAEPQPEEVVEEPQPEYHREIVYINRNEQPAHEGIESERAAPSHNPELARQQEGAQNSGGERQENVVYENANRQQHFPQEQGNQANRQPDNTSQDQRGRQEAGQALSAERQVQAAVARSEGEQSHQYGASYEEQPKEAVDGFETQPDASATK